jgi:hypothetical protein
VLAIQKNNYEASLHQKPRGGDIFIRKYEKINISSGGATSYSSISMISLLGS